jgi:dTDP-4-amino-4,6-dideoxygalactose transaminase
MIKFIDLAAQQERIRDRIQSRMNAVMYHGQYIMGPEVRELEEQLASYIGTKHCITCSSGTDALLMVLMAYDVGPGDAILTTPFTFISTVEVIQLLGARPIFVDIDPRTFNLDSGRLDRAIRKVQKENQYKIKGIIPVDIFGLPANYLEIETTAAEYGLWVLEDGAQSFGGSINGQKACSFGNAAATSFFPAKPLGCYGDGGAIFTNDDSLADIVTSIRMHGKGENKYDNVRIGLNGRLDTLQAAVLLEKLMLIDEEWEKKDIIADRYEELLHDVVVSPFVPDGFRSAWAYYSMLADSEEQRGEIMSRLKKRGIPSAIYYPSPLHLQQVSSHLGYIEGDFPVAEDVSHRVFSLPMHAYLQGEDLVRIVNVIHEIK